MKICPACKTQYTDDTLQFCLQDGTPLAFASQADTPTVVLDDAETLAIGKGIRMQVPIGDPNSAASQPSQAARFAPAAVPPRGPTALIVISIVIAGSAVLGLAAYGAWMFLRGSENPVVTMNTAANSNARQPNVINSNLIPSPSMTATRSMATPLPANTYVAIPPPVDKTQVSGEVQQKINNWRSLTESKNMSGLRAAYAPVLDFYYSKRGVSSSSVIADKENAFRDYDAMRIEVSNLSVTPDPSGETVTAVFNKNWTFEGVKPFCGSIRSEMRLRKVNGVWLIVGEKDVPGTLRRSC